EAAVVLMLAGVIVAFAVPAITSSMRTYRLNSAMRQIIDMLKRAKMEAVASSNRAGIAVDLAGQRIGIVKYKDDGVTVDRIDFVPLPEGVEFERPEKESAPPDGADADSIVSFPYKDGFYRQDFNSRGFPAVASGADVVSIFIGNGKDYRAVTVSSVGGVRAYRLEQDRWINTRSKNPEASSDTGQSSGDTGKGSKK
ncbi:MAG TPA: hypothetical protein VID27_22335, partial [Blastocatellia bacterium]